MAESSSEEGIMDMGDEEGGINWDMGLLRDSETMPCIEDMGLDADLTGNVAPINGAMEFAGSEEREETQALSAMEARSSFLDSQAMELQASQGGGQSAAESEVDVGTQNLTFSIKTEEGTGADSFFVAQDSPTIPRAESEVDVGTQNLTFSIKTEEGTGFFVAQDSPIMPRGMEEGRVPLWIKWRGKWQAGIQCSLEDCPAQTAKAMPTYGRKSYIVVFLPGSRSFVWTDWQLVCPISESPEPLASGSYESGRSSVADLSAARRYMLQKIITAMLDISDRLPIQAVVDCARDVSFWKDFAKEAAKAVTYQELGAMLMKLKSMILSTFVKEAWTCSDIDEWKHQCESVETAGSMENLVKELKNAVCWDEVGKLWDELEQTNLDSEWKTWKKEAHRNNPKQSKLRYSSVSVTGHRRTFDATEYTSEGSDGHAGNPESEQGCKRLKSEEQELLSNSRESWEGTSQQQLVIGKNDYILSLSAFVNKSPNLGPKRNSGTAGAQVENKTQINTARCPAFSFKKGRQCNKYPSDGALYCCKHDPAGRTEEQKKGKLPMPNVGGGDSNAVICGGMTKYGRRCTHKARDGSAFCLKHMMQDLIDPGERIAAENSALKISSAAEFGGAESNLGTPEAHGVSNRKRKLKQASVGQPSSTDSKIQETSKSAARMAARTANWTRCIGWCRGSGGQCSHRAKPGFSHCEKHLPEYRGKGQEKAYSKDVSAKTPNGEDERDLSRLKDLVQEYMRARLADDGARNSQRPTAWQKIIDWVLSEVAGNLKSSETLYDLITVEMENLKKYFEEEDAMEVQKSLVPFLTGHVDHVSCSVITPVGEKSIEHLSNVELLKQVSSTSTGHIPRFRCKLCAQEFVELIVLGQHWRGCHKKEAQQYFRGYTCQYCNLPFTNKKGLYRHRNTHHPGISSQTKSSLLALCIVCSGQFMNFEDLWQHVICSHPDQLCAFWPVTNSCGALGSASDQWQPSGSEIAEAGKCSHCDQKFATYVELQQHRDIAHGDHGHTSLVDNLRKDFDTMDELKYKCKICGLKFRLLPDLGRHHQAEHKPLQSMQWKNVKGEALVTGPIEELNSIIGVEKEKKKLQKLDVRRASGGQFKAEVHMVAQQNVESGDPTFAEIEGYSGPKLEGCPSSKDILAVARSACCKNQLYSVLQKKYAALPDCLVLKAAKLCSDANLRLQFYHEGYLCPNGCKEVAFRSTDTKPTLETSFPDVSCFPLLVQFNQALLDYKAILEKNNAVLTALSGLGENHDNKTVLCEDLSFGRERVPIPCVVDRDVMGACNCPMCVDNPSSHSETLAPWLHFCYVTKRTLDPSLSLDTESSRLGCSCQGHRCSSAECEHVYLFDNDNTDAEDIYGRPMAGRFPYDSQGCIILEEGYLVYECNSICSCNEDCQNRVLQKGVRVKLEVYKARHKGWGVRAAQPIARGTFVCEYIGEVLDDCEANKRGERYDKEGCSYLYNIDAHIDIGHRGRPKPFVIDATKFGNVARFINHSCSPNLVNYQVLVESMDCQLAHIGLYATRDIDVGEELAYDYRYTLLPGKGCPCHCGAKDCRGRLY